MDTNIIMFALVFMLVNNVYGEKNPEDIGSTLALKILVTSINSMKNTVVSILPLEFSFCKIASVARGKAKQELVKAMGFTNDTMVNTFYRQFDEMMRLPLRTDLTYVNKIYLDYSKNIDMKFSENSTALYGVHVDKMSYNMPKAAVNFINRAIASATYRRVEDVLAPGDITKLTSLLLITAGHFKPTWEAHFDPSLTSIRSFKLLNNTIVNLPMMEKIDDFQLYDAKDFRAVTIRLGNWGCSMTFVQPEFLSVDRVLHKLASHPGTMKDIRSKMTYKPLKLVLPRIKVKSQVDLDGFLKEIGIKTIFDKKSRDLNAILKEGLPANNIFVSKVRQKLFIEIDEFGLSRFNKNWYVPKPMEPPSTLEVALDRPFYFTVNFELSPTSIYELFNGVYYGPE